MDPRVRRWLVCAGLLGGVLLGPARADLRVVTSFYPIYIATLNVVGAVPGVHVVNMAGSVSGCLHDYQMTPENMITLSKANVFVVNGVGMESFLETAMHQFPALKVIDASAGIAVLKTGGVDNPHVWLSVSRHIRQVRNIGEGLALADPSHAGDYRRNAATYQAKLEALETKMNERLKTLRSRDLITFHEAFPYFAEEFRLRVVAVIEREPGAEPSAGELRGIIRTIRTSGVRAVFVEPQYPAKAAEAIARETGVTLSTLDPIVGGPPRPDAYLDIMERNLNALTAALE